jgi:hypothetical protein
MLEEVVIQSSDPMTLKVQDMDPEEILYLESITGLSPEGITLFTGDFARDGGYYQGRRIGKRNPVFTFKLNPNYAEDIEISDIRELLYKMFLEPQVNSDGVQVLLVDDRRPDRYFVGYTESVNTDMWDLVQKAQVSMVCVDPYLRSSDETSDSDVTGWISVPLTYDGSAATGLEMEIKVTATTPTVIIDLNGELMTLTHPVNFLNNDIININTIIGQRAITLTRSAVTTDVMAYLTGTPKWPTLNAVANTLQVYGSVIADAKARMMSYSYRSAWWGI